MEFMVGNQKCASVSEEKQGEETEVWELMCFYLSPSNH